MGRRNKNNYYLDLADVVSERSTCLRRRFGAVIVKDDEVIAKVIVRDTDTKYRVIDVNDWIINDESIQGEFGY